MNKEKNPSNNEDFVNILNNQTKEILKEVSKKTGRPVKLLFNMPKEMKGHLAASVHPYFQNERGFHLIILNDYKKIRPHINNTIIHECLHILRQFEVPSSEWRARVILPHNLGNVLREKPEIQKEINEIIKKYKQTKLKNINENINGFDFFEEIIKGAVKSLVNTPEEIQIDKYIWENYSQIKEEQREELEKLIPEHIGKIHHFNLIDKKVLPSSLCYFSQIETIFLAAYLNFSVKLLGVENLLNDIGTSKIDENNMGKEILEEILNVQNQGYKGTENLVEKYSHQFLIKNYFTSIVGKENIENFFNKGGYR